MDSDFQILKFLNEGHKINSKKVMDLLPSTYSNIGNALRKLKILEEEGLIIESSCKSREKEFEITELGKVRLQQYEVVSKRRMERVEQLTAEANAKLEKLKQSTALSETVSEELRDFFKLKKAEIVTDLRRGNLPTFSFEDLDSFSPRSGDLLLTSPKEFFNHAYTEMNDVLEFDTSSSLMVTDFPDSIEKQIPELRNSDVGKLVKVKGVIRRASVVYSVPIKTIYVCKDCGNHYELIHTLFNVKKLRKCHQCGAEVAETSVEKEDRMKIDLEEDISNISSEPKRILCYLQPFLCRQEYYDKLKQVGSRIEFVGVIKEKATKIGDGDNHGIFYQKYLDVISVKWSAEDFPSIETSVEDENRIIQYSKTPRLIDNIIKALAPSIEGRDEIKKALLLQQFGGINYPAKDGEPARRGVIHIYLGGDPSVAKSQLGRAMAQLAPRVRYAVGGKGSSSDTTFGMAAKQDKETKEWYFEGGVLIMANRGLCVIDEGHECSDEQLNSLKEPMEQMTVTKNAAGINAQAKAETAVLFIANPKYDFFDLHQPFSDQIRMPPALFSRFDLKFVMLDKPDRNLDTRAITSMFRLRRNVPSEDSRDDIVTFVKKYIAYAKRKIQSVTIPSSIQEQVMGYVLDLRSKQTAGPQDGERPKILLRNVESIIRMLEASARMRLSDTVNQEDWDNVKALYDFQMASFGFDPETGRFDIDLFEGRSGLNKIKKLRSAEELFDSLCKQLGTKEIDRKYFLQKIEEEFNRTPAEAYKTLQGLLNSSVLYSPTHNLIARIP